MQEVICCHIGQAGIQISNAAWELFCIEHGIEASGRLKESLQDDDSLAFKTFFYEAPTGQYVPRCLTFDLEPTVVDEIRTGNYRNLFHPEQIINGLEDGSNNYARGHFTIGKNFIEESMNVLRRIAENCDSLQGFMILQSHGGGTGSGFTSLILDSLSINYAKSPRLQLSVFPSPTKSTAVVEPYNCVLASIADIEKSDVTILVNNEAIYDICSHLLMITRPTFNNLNRIISHVFSDLTVSLRFESSLNADLIQLATNLIPFPRIHFPLLSHAPLICANKAEHEELTVNQITRSIFHKSSHLLTVDCHEGLYMCCVMQYRGSVTPKDVNNAIFEVKRRQEIKFVEWCPTGFKLGINSQPTTSVPGSEICQTERSVSMVCNSTAIKQPIEQILSKFDVLFSKRSFVHWFVGEGMEEGEFNEARDEFRSLVQDYDEIATSEDEEEEGDGAPVVNETAPPPPPVDSNDEDDAPMGGDPDGDADGPLGGEDAETDGGGGETAGGADDPVEGETQAETDNEEETENEESDDEDEDDEDEDESTEDDDDENYTDSMYAT